MFYTLHYEDWKLCNAEGEDATCCNQYYVDMDVGKYYSQLLLYSRDLLFIVNHLNYLDMDFTSNYLTCGKSY